MTPKYCPECRSEFREDVAECPDCGVALVVKLPAEDHEHEPMVSVLDAVDTEELMVAKMLLESADIECLLEDAGATPGLSFGGSFDPAGQPTHLMVPESRAAEARALLAQK